MAVVPYLLIPVALFGALFFTSFFKEPRRLLNGLLFNLFGITVLTAAAGAILASNNRLLIAVFATLFVIALLVIGVLFALHLVWLLWNARVVWRREGHSLGNMLTLLIAIGLLLLEIAASIGRGWLPDPVYNGLAVFFSLAIGYELVALYNFLTALVLYNLYRPRRDKDYLIVLGSGLIGGDRVSPLLAARINAGLKFYRKQLQKTGKHATLVFSGGQGPDEKLPEGLAMQRFALAAGIPEADTLVEGASKTTYQNMLFSKRLIESRTAGQPYKAAFFTNNYHLLRAGIFARAAGLAANGVGAATSFYFLPNAVIREYLAFVVIHKRRHIVILGLIAAFGLAVALQQAFLP
ncbi:YdcF family protein [Lacticaseibacillus suihuaensis]